MAKLKVGQIYLASNNSTYSSSNSYLRTKGYKFKITHITTSGYETYGGYCTVLVQSPKSKSWLNGGYVYGNELKGNSGTKEDLLKEIEDIKKEIKEKESEINNLNTKITFLEESGLAEYDEDTYKVFIALTTIENKKLSKLEKAKVVSDLINS